MCHARHLPADLQLSLLGRGQKAVKMINAQGLHKPKIMHHTHLNLGLSCGLPGSKLLGSVSDVNSGDGKRSSFTVRPKPKMPSLSLKSGELQW